MKYETKQQLSFTMPWWVWALCTAGAVALWSAVFLLVKIAIRNYL